MSDRENIYSSQLAYLKKLFEKESKIE
jgi:hypothetical protein